jgi:hypothetical protein
MHKCENNLYTSCKIKASLQHHFSAKNNDFNENTIILDWRHTFIIPSDKNPGQILKHIKIIQWKFKIIVQNKEIFQFDHTYRMLSSSYSPNIRDQSWDFNQSQRRRGKFVKAFERRAVESSYTVTQ